jgi:hypothetical protein
MAQRSFILRTASCDVFIPSKSATIFSWLSGAVYALYTILLDSHLIWHSRNRVTFYRSKAKSISMFPLR